MKTRKQTELRLKVGDVIGVNIIDGEGGVTGLMLCRVKHVSGRTRGNKIVALERLPDDYLEAERRANEPEHP